MKLLVTGGCGFIGSNFIRYLLSKNPDHMVVNFDKLTYAGNPENLRDLRNDKRYSFIRGDICDPKAVEKAVQGIDVIINFAAETHVDRSILSAGSFVNTDVYGTYILLEAVKKFGIKRYIQISTDEVYGSVETGSFNEKSPLSPNSPYAASKAGGDLLVLAYGKTYGLPVIVTRSSNNYGPYQYPEKMISLFVTNLLTGKKVPVYGDGRNVRDWLFVEDNCRALDLVLRRGKEGEIYNIGGGNERENIEIVKFILLELKLPDTMIEFVKDRPGHDRRYSIDCAKAKSELGWEPSTDLEKGLAQTVKWYRDNGPWWKKIKGKSDDFFNNWYKKR